MAAFVLDHTTVPPGGVFYYVQPENGARIEAQDYTSWMDAIERFRKANGLELEPLWKLHVEQWLCHDLHENKKINWCRIQGVGDIIAYGLRPITIWVDQYAGTHLSTCSGCAGRQKALNRIGQ